MICFSGYNFHDFYHERKNRCISYDVWLFVIYCTKRNLKTSFIFFNTFELNIVWLKYDWKKCRHLSSGSQHLVSNAFLFWGLYLSTLRWDLSTPSLLLPLSVTEQGLYLEKKKCCSTIWLWWGGGGFFLLFVFSLLESSSI